MFQNEPELRTGEAQIYIQSTSMLARESSLLLRPAMVFSHVSCGSGGPRTLSRVMGAAA